MTTFGKETPTAPPEQHRPILSDIPEQVQRLIAVAVETGASDIHINPAANGCDIRLRVDGLLESHGTTSSETGAAIVSRLMVMAQLLTYRRDVPQEGRAAVVVDGIERPIALRISIMPTTHGLRAAVRLPAELNQPRTLNTLGLDAPVLSLINQFIHADSGVLAIIGPAGSGKTTTAYAILEAIRDHNSGVSIVSLEDPVERDLPGITQIQVQPFGQLTYATALRSMLRQDPQVLMLGEIRDAETASIAVQAGLSGHRLLCTLHAADAAQAVSRLLEMQLEPYQISSSLMGIISQRLLRKKSNDTYRGRLPIGEAVPMTDQLRQSIASRGSTDTVRASYEKAPGYRSLMDSAKEKTAAGVTDSAEVARVLGHSP